MLFYFEEDILREMMERMFCYYIQNFWVTKVVEVVDQQTKNKTREVV